MANYSDWELHSSNPADMQTAISFLGFTQGDGYTKVGGVNVRYTINIYGSKYVDSTTDFITDRFGTRPVKVALPGVYAILRWWSPTSFPPPGINMPPQITVIPIPADSPYVFAAA
jgi:hypothetical protein